jgi:hypothetical protein
VRFGEARKHKSLARKNKRLALALPVENDTNSNEAIAVSRITQNDQIGLLEPRVGT